MSTNERVYTVQELLIENHRMMMQLDVKAAQRFLTRDSEVSSEEVALCALHKARYDFTMCERRGNLNIPRELRLESGAWLRERGYNRFNDMPLLPEGELP